MNDLSGYAAAYFAAILMERVFAFDVPVLPASPDCLYLGTVFAEVPQVGDNERWVGVLLIDVASLG